jgi:type IX secretion system PorP/SprF family membrane protein
MFKKHNINYLLVACFLMSCAWLNKLNAQDLHFSQFYEAPLLRNPALAGLYEGDVRIQGIYRSQWGSISNPFQTGSINGEYKFAVGKGDDFLTVGGQVMYDKAGTVKLQTVHLLPMVNFHKSLSQEKNTYLSLGFMGGIVDRRLDRSRVTTNSQYDGFYYNGALPDGETFSSGYSYSDMSVGMSLNSTLGAEDQHTFFAGVAYHHVTKPLNSFYKNISHLPKWVLSGGLKMNLDEFTFITLNGDLTVQEPFKEAIAGGMISKRLGESEGSNYTVHAGTYYRYKDALIPVIKFDVNKISVGLSYDINISTLASASRNRGGFELSLTYLTSRQHDNPVILCPKF